MNVQMHSKFNLIDREGLRQKLENEPGKFRLWNVLKKEYYHHDKNIPGSKWVPVDQLPQALPALNAGKDEEIVVYCGGFQCPSSKQAAEYLVGQGYRNVSAYEGGVADWAEAGLPFVKLEV